MLQANLKTKNTVFKFVSLKNQYIKLIGFLKNEVTSLRIYLLKFFFS